MSYGPQLLLCDSADFDGANDFMSTAGDLSGSADSKSGILSMWLRIDGTLAAFENVLRNRNGTNPSKFRAVFASDKFAITGTTSAGSTVVDLVTVSTFSPGATWYHFLASWDAAASAGHLYVNDVSDLASPSWLDQNIDYTDGAWSIAGDGFGASAFDGCIAEFYFAQGQYIDFSIAANRRKFISASGKPVYLGADGSFPTGTAPIVYQRVANGAAVATFATNLGTGGDFSITGTLETGSTSPSD